MVRVTDPVLRRRPARPSGAPRLDEQQARVVAHPGGPLLVLAGPGTGKTTTLVEAVVDRVERRGLAPGAGARPDLQPQGGAGAARARDRPARPHDPRRAGHDLPLLRLRAAAPRARGRRRAAAAAAVRSGAGPRGGPPARGRAATTVRPTGRRPCGRRCRCAASGASCATCCSGRRSAASTAACSPRLGADAGRPEWTAAGRFLDDYEGRFALDPSAEVLDHSGLVRAAAGLLEGDDELRARERAARSVVVVDEYQDTDPAQVRLLQALAGDGRDLVAVGDPDQSIYAFRGADVRGILDFPDDFPTVDGPAGPGRRAAHLPPVRARCLLAASRSVARRLPAGRLSRRSASCGPTRPSSASPGAGRGPARRVADRRGGARGRRPAPGPPARRARLVRHGGPAAVDPALAGGPAARAARGRRPRRRAGRRGAARRGAAGPGAARRAQRGAAPRRGHAPTTCSRCSPVRSCAPTAWPCAGCGAPCARPTSPRAARARPTTLLVRGRSSTRGCCCWSPTRPPPRDRLHRLLRAVRVGRARRAPAPAPPSRCCGPCGRPAAWPAGSSRTACRRRRRGALADRSLDAVLALFDAAARYVDRLPHGSVLGFVDDVEAQEVPGDTLAQRTPEGDAVRVMTAHASKGLEWPLVVVAGVQEGVWPDLRLRGSLLGADDLAGRRRRPASAVRRPDDARRPAGRAARRGAPAVLRRGHPRARAPGRHRGRGRRAGPAEPLRRGARRRRPRPGQRRRSAAHRQRPGRRAAPRRRDHRRPGAARGGLPPPGPRGRGSTPSRRRRPHVASAHPDRWWGLAPLSEAAPLVGEGEAVRVSPSQGRVLRHLLAALVPRERRRRRRQQRPGAGRRLARARAGRARQRRRRARRGRPDGPARRGPARARPRRPLDGPPAAGGGRRSSCASSSTGSAPASASSSAPSSPSRCPSAGGAVLSGRVDRLERDDDGRAVVVDLKTGQQQAVHGPTSPATPSSASTSSPSRSGAFAEQHGLTEPGGAALLQLKNGKRADEQLQPRARRRRRPRLGARARRARRRGHERQRLPGDRQRALRPHLRRARQLPRLARGRVGAAMTVTCGAMTVPRRAGPRRAGRCRSSGSSPSSTGRSATSRPPSSPRRSRRASSWRAPAAARRPRWSPGSSGSSARAWSPPDQVLGLTFTTKAADELRLPRPRRACAGCAPPGCCPTRPPTGRSPGALEPTVSTYHAYAARLVRDHALRLGREPGARLVTPATSWQLAARAVGAYDGPMDAGHLGRVDRRPGRARAGRRPRRAPRRRRPRCCASATTCARWPRGTRKLQSAGEEGARRCRPPASSCCPSSTRYAALKRERELLDFGDVVALAAELARTCPQVREVERATSRVVLLDEYQDTGRGAGGAAVGAVRRRPPGDGRRRPLPEHLRLARRERRHAAPLPDLVRRGRARPAHAEHHLPQRRAAAAPGQPRLRRAAHRGGARPAAAPGARPGGRRRGALRAAARRRHRGPLGGRAGASPAWRSLPAEPDGAALVARGGAVPQALDVPPPARGLRRARRPRRGGRARRPAGRARGRRPARDAAGARRPDRRRGAAAPAHRCPLAASVRATSRPWAGAPARSSAAARASPDDPVEAVVLGVDESQVGSLVDALDDLPPAGERDPLSAEGRRRLEALRDELRALRRRVDQPLPDLVGDVERTLGLDVEVSARPGTTDPAAARADLDAFADAAAQFAGDIAQDGAGRGRAVGVPGPPVGRGGRGARPRHRRGQRRRHGQAHDRPRGQGPRVARRRGPRAGAQHLRRRGGLPGQAGGEHLLDGQLPPAAVPAARRPRRPARRCAGLEPERRSTAHLAAIAARDAREERRLAYVAVTRAEHLLLCSGYHWGEGATVVGPSVFLDEARAACLDGAGEVARGWRSRRRSTPSSGPAAAAAWPSRRAAGGRRPSQAAAARVRELLARGSTTGRSPDERSRLDARRRRRVVDRWDDDLRRLAEEAARRRARRSTALLPPVLSVTGLVELRARPGGAGALPAAAAAPAAVAGDPPRHRLPRLARVDGLRPAAAARPRRPARRRRPGRRRRRRPARAAGRLPGERVVGPRAGRDRGALRDGGRGAARARPHRRRLRRGRRRLGRRRLEDRPPSVRRRRARPRPCSSRPTGWPGTSSPERRSSGSAPPSATSATASTVRPADLLDAARRCARSCCGCRRRRDAGRRARRRTRPTALRSGPRASDAGHHEPPRRRREGDLERDDPPRPRLRPRAGRRRRRRARARARRRAAHARRARGPLALGQLRHPHPAVRRGRRGARRPAGDVRRRRDAGHARRSPRRCCCSCGRSARRRRSTASCPARCRSSRPPRR